MPDSLSVVETAEAQAKLDAIAASGACQRGSVFLLDFAAIRDRFGDRWESKRATVWARLDQIVLAYVGRAGLSLRSSDVEYIVSFSAERGLAARAVAFRIMEAALSHFLGVYETADISVYAVPEVTAAGVRTERLDPGEIVDAPPAAAAPSTTASEAPRQILLSGNANRLSFSLDIQGVFHVRSEMQIGVRLGADLLRMGSARPLTPAERHDLPTPVLLQIDRIATERALLDLTTRDTNFIVVLPLSLNTVLSGHSRGIILAMLQQLSEAEASRLLIEIVGTMEGTPASRVLDAAVLVRPFCRRVIFQAALSKSVLGVLRQARSHGLTVSARELGASDQKIAANIVALGEALRGLSSLTMAVDLSDRTYLSICAVAGLSHASVVGGADANPYRLTPSAANATGRMGRPAQGAPVDVAAPIRALA